MIYKTHSKEVVLKKLSNFQPLNYNQFRWWRRWDSKNKPLHKLKPLLDKIRNGDFDYSHYYWQAQFCEIELNEKYLQLNDDGRWMEETQVDRARRKRLYEDFEKDEQDKLNELYNEFPKYFRVSKDQVKEEMAKFSGSLIDFYYHMDDKYKIVHISYEQIKKRGRPRKTA